MNTENMRKITYGFLIGKNTSKSGTKIFSLEQCRRIDPRLRDMSDAELTMLRDSLYEAAELSIDSWFKYLDSKNPKGDSLISNNAV